MDTLNKRQIQILYQIKESTDSMSSEYLAKTMGISSKTIRKEILEVTKVMEQYGAHILSKTGSGYTLHIYDQRRFDDFISKCDHGEHKISESSLPTIQRAHYIIRKLLVKNDYIKINDIADELYTSRTTTTSDMRIVKDILSEYELSIIQRPNHGLILKGKEHHIRLCMVDEYSYYKNNDLFVNEQEYNDLFQVDEEVYNEIENIVFQAQVRFASIDISYQNIQKIIWMIILSSKRCEYDLVSSYSQDEIYAFQSRNSYHIAKYILRDCEPLLHMKFKREDMILLTIYLLSFRCFLEYKDLHYHDRFYDYYEISENLIDHLCEINEFKELYRDPQLQTNLALHFIPMQVRLEYRVKIDYVPKNLVKQKSPTAMELAVQSSLYLKEKLHLLLTEDEICYLALVFFPIFGRYNTGIHKRRLIFVSSISKTVGATMAERFERNFPHYIQSISIKEVYELRSLNLKDYDLIFTDLNEGSIKYTQIPIIHIATFFSENDKKDLRNILTLGNTKFSKMKDYFHKDFFFANISLRNRKEVFQFLYESLQKKLPLPKEFYDDLLIRDDVSTIEIGNNVAMMKTLHSYHNTSFISVLILDKPILWKMENVQIVVMWHRGIHDQTNTEIFESGYMGNVLKSIFSISEKIVNLLQKPDFDTMITMIKERIESTRFLDSMSKQDEI